jgi:hypothetical protein
MRKIASAQGLRTLYQEGLHAVAEGLTSLDEINCLAYTGVAASDAESAAPDADSAPQI